MSSEAPELAGSGEPVPATTLVVEESMGRGTAVRTIGLVPSFDGLRAVAVLVILAWHIAADFVPSAQVRWFKGGYAGVDIFFVLSGFLITSILIRQRERTERAGLGSFYARRALRLLPALFAFVIVQAIWATVIGVPEAREVPSIFSVLFYYSNQFHSSLQLAPGLGHVWSLQVEEQFYVLWPLLLVVCLARFRRREVAAAMTGVLIVAVAVYRWHTMVSSSNPAIILSLYGLAQYRADSLLVGALAAQLWANGWLPRRGLSVAAWFAGAFVVWWLATVGLGNRWIYGWGFTGLAVMVAIVVLALVQTNWPVKRVLSVKPLRIIGMVSYGIYLWHYLVFSMVGYAWPHWNAWWQSIVGLTLTAVATCISWFLIERPFLRIKDRIGSGAAVVPAEPPVRVPAPVPALGASMRPGSDAVPPVVVTRSAADRPVPVDQVDPLVAALFADPPEPE
jgi:peptidoglycan/LPS O-acetylase OafA/YrhL